MTSNLVKVDRTAEVRDQRRELLLQRKPNGHRLACVCRSCFEVWLAEQAPIRAERERLAHGVEAKS